MEDPAILIAILKVVMMLVMVVAAVVIGRELVSMARGRSMPEPIGEESRKS
jgi:hypothetical protein